MFWGRGPGGAALRSGDLGGHPPQGQGPGGVSYPGGNTAYGLAPAEDTRREVEIKLGNSGKGGGRIIDEGGVYQAAAEHSRTVHCYKITVRTVWGFRKVTGGASIDAAVGTGGT